MKRTCILNHTQSPRANGLVIVNHSGCEVNLDEPTIPTGNTSLSYIQVTVEEISKMLSSLDVHKVIGRDNLPTLLLKERAESLAPSITTVIYFSLREGVQLTNWKKANVSPIFKKGNTNLAENYRPESLPPVISKVQERCSFPPRPTCQKHFVSLPAW